MENQRRQSQAADVAVKLTAGNEVELVKCVPDTEFVGYDILSSHATVKGLLLNGEPVTEGYEGSDIEIMLDRTPFYAESGGQIGDNGFLYYEGNQDGKRSAIVEIKDVQKTLGNIFVHKGTIREGKIEVGSEVSAAVDPRLRKRAKCQPNLFKFPFTSIPGMYLVKQHKDWELSPVHMHKIRS